MTQIDFYTNVSDKFATACRIVAKAYSLKHRIVVLCPDAETAQRIDRMLWLTPPTGFIPHCTAPHALAQLTPIVIDYSGNEPVHDELLVNLRPERPAFFGRFERLVEIVSLEEEDKTRARDRFRFYRDRGYEIRTHDLERNRVGVERA